MVTFVWISGDMEGATALLQRCLEQDSTSSDCHVLMAQVQFLLSSNFTLISTSNLNIIYQSNERNFILNYLRVEQVRS